MNDSKNRLPWQHLMMPFDANAESSTKPYSSSSGILGNLGLVVDDSGPDVSLTPTTLPHPQYWDFQANQSSDPDAEKFLTAWRRVYSAPSPLGAWFLTSATQPTKAIGANRQGLGPAPDFGSVSDSAPSAKYAIASNWALSPPKSSADDVSAQDRFSSLQRSRSADGSLPFPAAPSSAFEPSPANGPAWGQASGDAVPGQVLSDALPENEWIPGADYAANGHHPFPRSVYLGMRPATQRVLDKAKTGKLLVSSINGRRHEFDEFHRQYNDAVRELLDRFMKQNNISRPYDVTPNQARVLLREIEVSADPRIATYRNFIRLFRLLPWLRSGGRGME